MSVSVRPSADRHPRSARSCAVRLRDYGDDAATRLLFVSRARKMGLSCEQIIDLLPIWDGTHCAGARERVDQLISDKQAELARAGRGAAGVRR